MNAAKEGVDVPRVTAVVVQEDRTADAASSIHSLIACRWPALEIVVVGRSSANEASTPAQDPDGVRRIQVRGDASLAGGVNLAWHESGCAYLAVIRAGVQVDPSWLDRLVSFLETHPETAAAGGKIYLCEGSRAAGDHGHPYRSWILMDPDTGRAVPTMNELDQVREVATLSDAALLVRSSAIDAVGGQFLEPALAAGYEVTDFLARAIRKGWKVHYIGDPPSWLRTSACTQRYRQAYDVQRSWLLFAHRHLPEARLQAVRRALARNALDDLVSHPLAVLGLDQEDTNRRARRDAWVWAWRNRRLLREHRARVARGGMPWDRVVRSIESRNTYYAHERPEVAALVPRDARFVVDVGCASGALGAALKRSRPGLQVRGIEPVKAQADRAKLVLDDAVGGRAEDPLPAHWPQPDCVIFADVLEHLADPWSTLRHWHRILRPGGTIVVSLPNVAHNQVLRGLLRGRWDYEDAGILDRTHLRFFTRETALELLEETGFEVIRFERAVQPERSFAGRQIARWATGKSSPKHLGARWADLFTLQFLLVGRRA